MEIFYPFTRFVCQSVTPSHIVRVAHSVEVGPSKPGRSSIGRASHAAE